MPPASSRANASAQEPRCGAARRVAQVGAAPAHAMMLLGDVGEVEEVREGAGDRQRVVHGHARQLVGQHAEVGVVAGAARSWPARARARRSRRSPRRPARGSCRPAAPRAAARRHAAACADRHAIAPTIPAIGALSASAAAHRFVATRRVSQRDCRAPAQTHAHHDERHVVVLRRAVHERIGAGHDPRRSGSPAARARAARTSGTRRASPHSSCAAFIASLTPSVNATSRSPGGQLHLALRVLAPGIRPITGPPASRCTRSGSRGRVAAQHDRRVVPGVHVGQAPRSPGRTRRRRTSHSGWAPSSRRPAR